MGILRYLSGERDPLFVTLGHFDLGLYSNGGINNEMGRVNGIECRLPLPRVRVIIKIEGLQLVSGMGLKLTLTMGE